MRWLQIAATFVFLTFAVVQGNDPDPLRWALIYALIAAISCKAIFGRVSPLLSGFGLVVCVLAAAPLLPSLIAAGTSSFANVGMANLRDEEAREAAGLLLGAVWMAFLLVRRNPFHQADTDLPKSLSLLLLLNLGCIAAVQATPSHPSPVGHITVPETPEESLRTRAVISRGLKNPRGLLVSPSGNLLVATAGSGSENDGALLRLPKNPDGNYGPPIVLLADQPSRNLIELVRRDEVFGLAALKRGGTEILLSAAFFDGPSEIFSVKNDSAHHTQTVPGNVNDLAWDPERGSWFLLSSSSEELLKLGRGNTEPVLRFPKLDEGQDAVPGYLRFDSSTGELLVSLFSGSPLGEEAGDGTELVPRAGKIVSVNPETRTIRPVVEGLTAPTDFEVSSDGNRIWVLEFCDSFLEPTPRRDELFGKTRHGGFRRFSGRLLEIDRRSGIVTTIADGLDTPTNLVRRGNFLFVSEGMGTPGRPIPGPDGESVPLEGFVERIDLGTKEGASG